MIQLSLECGGLDVDNQLTQNIEGEITRYNVLISGKFICAHANASSISFHNNGCYFIMFCCCLKTITWLFSLGTLKFQMHFAQIEYTLVNSRMCLDSLVPLTFFEELEWMIFWRFVWIILPMVYFGCMTFTCSVRSALWVCMAK